MPSTWRQKNQLRVARPKRRSRPGPGGNQVVDEDVARWRLTVSEPDAVALARQAGFGVPCLPVAQFTPTLSPEKCRNAVDYVNTLPEDVRHSVFKHCELISRHERLLLEGQERLRYVQAQIRELKASLPPVPPPNRNRPSTPQEKGPPVTIVPIRDPTCWASCCGMRPLPWTPPPPQERPAGPVAIQLPPPEYFQQAAAAGAAARRRTRQASAGGAYASAGGASASEHVQPVSGSVGGASDAAAPAARAAPLEVDGAAAAAELPGQLEGGEATLRPTGHGAPVPPDPATVVGTPTAMLAGAPPAGEPASPPATHAQAPLGALLPRPMLAPLQSKAPGAPQSLLRPLAPLPYAGAQAAVQEQGRLEPLPPQPRQLEQAAQELEQQQELGLPGRQAGQEQLAGHGGQLAAAEEQAADPGPHGLGRYEDPESLRRITSLQAAQRGKAARKHASALRADREREQRQKRERELLAAEKQAAEQWAAEQRAEGQRVAEQRAAERQAAEQQAAEQRAAAERAAEQEAAEWQAAEEEATELLAARQLAAEQQAAEQQAAEQQAASSGPYDLRRYDDPESLRRITALQATQRGKAARRHASTLRAERQQQQQEWEQEQDEGQQWQLERERAEEEEEEEERRRQQLAAQAATAPSQPALLPTWSRSGHHLLPTPGG